ncbi:MAG: oligosaccharide flippase family protein [Phycisphaerales bacterium]
MPDASLPPTHSQREHGPAGGSAWAGERGEAEAAGGQERARDEGPAGGASPQIGSAVKRGMTWTVANTVVAKGLSFVSIAVLGLLLTPEDFGIYGISFSIAAFLQVFRDGGVVQLLVQRGEAAYGELRGPVFWMAGAFNAVTGGVLALLAPVLSRAYGSGELMWLLVVIGVSMPLATPGVVLQARLAMQLRFGTIARIQLMSSIIRYGGTITLAWMGMGPLCFVLPLPVIAAYEGVAAYAATGESPWRDGARVGVWRGLFLHSRWLILQALASASINQGCFLMLGAMVDKSVVGVFFFAYQLITQIDAVLAATAGVVLFPALSRLAPEPERFRAALLRACRTIVFLGAPATGALLAGMDAFENMMWHARWSAAVLPVQALSVLYAARVLFTVPGVALMAQGKFKACAMIVLACGVGLMLVTGASALANPTPDSIAVWIGAYLGLGCLACSLIIMRRLGVETVAAVRSIVPPWGAAWVAAGAAMAVDTVVRGVVLPAPGTALDFLARSATTFPFWAAFESTHDASAGLGAVLSGAMKLVLTISGAVRLAIIASVLAGVYFGVMRVLFPTRLREGLHLAPARFHAMLDRVFLLRSRRAR